MRAEHAAPEQRHASPVVRPKQPAPARPVATQVSPASVAVAGLSSPSLAIRPKLEVGRVADPTEVDADRVADEVVAALHGGVHVHGPEVFTVGAIRRASQSGRRAGGDVEVGAAGGPLSAELDAAVDAARGGGSPLPTAIRRMWDTTVGSDIGEVRIHTGPQADALSTAISAKAFTVGNDVFFRGGLPSLSTVAGTHLIAHELAHVAQHAGAPSTARRSPIRRAVQIDCQISPAETVADDPVAVADVSIERVVMPHKARPPRAREGQGRHVVAWAARLREWETCFKGPLSKVLEALQFRVTDDRRHSANTAEDYDALQARLTALTTPDRTMTPLAWEDAVTRLVADYVLAYQRSDFASFDSARPKGKSEANYLRWLTDCEQDPDLLSHTKKAELESWFNGLVDLQGSQTEKRAKASRDLAVIGHDVFPLCWAKAHPGSVKPVNAAPTSSEAPATDTDVAMHLPDGVSGVHGAESADFPVRLVLSSGATAGEARTSTCYVVDQVRIGSERAANQHGGSQGSHVVPWALERVAMSRRFAGTRLDLALEELSQALAAVPQRMDQSRELTSLREQAEALDLAGPRRAVEWKEVLNLLARAVVEAGQAAPHATFGAEVQPDGTSKPESHAEGPALDHLENVESALSAGETDELDETELEERARLAKLVQHLHSLLDLPGLMATREHIGLGDDELSDVREHWLATLTRAYPRLMEKHDEVARTVFWDKVHGHGVKDEDYLFVQNALRTAQSSRGRGREIAAMGSPWSTMTVSQRDTAVEAASRVVARPERPERASGDMDVPTLMEAEVIERELRNLRSREERAAKKRDRDASDDGGQPVKKTKAPERRTVKPRRKKR